MKAQFKKYSFLLTVLFFSVSSFSANAQTPTPAPFLSVIMAVIPPSGNAPLEDVDILAMVSGTAQGDISYYYYCNRSDDGTNVTTDYAKKIENAFVNSYRVNDVCDYNTAGTYTVKVIAEREGVAAQNRTEIIVSAAPTPTSTPTPTPTPTVTPTPTPTPTPTLTPTPSATPTSTPTPTPTTTPTPPTPTPTPAQIPEIPYNYKFTVTLKYGQRSNDVKYLQAFLKSQGAEVYPEGLVTGYFGLLTKNAVIRFQEKYKSEILSPFGLTNGTGLVGQKTNAKINQILGR